MPAWKRKLYASITGIALPVVLAFWIAGTSAPVARAKVIADDSFDYRYGKIDGASGGRGWHADQGWKTHGNAACYVCDEPAEYTTPLGETMGAGYVVGVHGVGSKNIPLRRQLKQPYTGRELFVRFLFKYDSRTLDDAASRGDGEFFVLWLDDIDSGDGAGHTVALPNIGVRIRHAPKTQADATNQFMVRFRADNPTYSNTELQGDRTYLIVARLSKLRDDPLAPYEQLDLWVDPAPKDISSKPDASVRGATINSVRWIGFETGVKTEPEDFIVVDELALGEHWQDVVPGATEQPPHEGQNLSIPSSELVDFRRDVFPILEDRCFGCHQGRDSASGTRLDVREEILGHFQGKALALPGQSKNSPLLEVLTADDPDERMPLDDDPLSEKEISTIAAWIDQGLAWDDKLLPTDPPRSDHWAYQRIRHPQLPRPKNKAWCQNPIDAFIATRHEQLGLVPTERADRRTLLRRVTLDLTGLPPTLAEIEAFLADDSPDAFAKVVDRLLDSTAYGERWGRHWLDLARWAESDGYQQNTHRPHAWRYRDYVIESFAKNKRFDRFTLEQLAGDEISPHTDENIIATGFLAAARYSGNELDKIVQRNDILVDITNTTANTFLSMTMQCAQCHSHKFDPIDARDYYRFQGFFAKGQPVEILLHESHGDETPEKRQQVLSAISDQYQMLNASRARAESSRRRSGLPVTFSLRTVVGGIAKSEKSRFKKHSELVKTYERTWGYYSPVTSSTTLGVPYLTHTSPLEYSLHQLQRAEPVLYVRGDVTNPGPQVDVGWPALFGPTSEQDNIDHKPRTALAQWLTSRDNPLTARVWVNRIWLNHFGEGLVTTPDDFGTQGASPSHPELLDWLAMELIDSGWDTNHVHRLIVSSSTYQQSSRPIESNLEIDPDNQFVHRWIPRRLQAEAVRDSMLAVSGLLDTSVGGPSIPLKERKSSRRRTVYLEQKRGDLPFVQQMFDAPAGLTSCGRRRTSTVALQPLYLLNDPTAYQYASAFAERVQQHSANDRDQQIDFAYELALGRLPDQKERNIFRRFFQESELSDTETLVQWCHALLNLNEFIYQQ